MVMNIAHQPGACGPDRYSGSSSPWPIGLHGFSGISAVVHIQASTSPSVTTPLASAAQ